MQYIKISRDATLSQLNKRIGSRNTDAVLQCNNVERVRNIGMKFYQMCENASINYSEVGPDGVTNYDVSYQRRISILNALTSDADVFEAAALQSGEGWKVLSSLNTLPGYLKIPTDIQIADGPDVLGGAGIGISKTVYIQAMKYLQSGVDIDPIIFNEYSDRRSSGAIINTQGSNDVYQWFRIPWGEITLYSSLSNSSVDIPVFPEEISDERNANYDTMPELLYQYEPWQVYKSSGPRTNTYTFKMHRDMWTGDHRDNKCNELIRFCQANCYPEFHGSVVHTALVTLYISGKPLITGIMTSVKTNYSGPYGLDNMPLYVEMSLTITEVSQEALNFGTVSRKGVIG